MKKISILLLLLISMGTFSIAQEKGKEISSNDLELKNYTNAKYRLFHTENEWTFIKLNTANGIIFQVKVDIENDESLQTYINTLPLVDKTKEVNDRFTLVTTENVYTFILLDQVDGRIWKVYWSLEPEERDIIQIK